MSPYALNKNGFANVSLERLKHGAKREEPFFGTRFTRCLSYPNRLQTEPFVLRPQEEMWSIFNPRNGKISGNHPTGSKTCLENGSARLVVWFDGSKSGTW